MGPCSGLGCSLRQHEGDKPELARLSWFCESSQFAFGEKDPEERATRGEIEGFPGRSNKADYNETVKPGSGGRMDENVP